jgi:hypothetical protein
MTGYNIQDRRIVVTFVWIDIAVVHAINGVRITMARRGASLRLRSEPAAQRGRAADRRYDGALRRGGFRNSQPGAKMRPEKSR